MALSMGSFLAVGARHERRALGWDGDCARSDRRMSTREFASESCHTSSRHGPHLDVMPRESGASSTHGTSWGLDHPLSRVITEGTCGRGCVQPPPNSFLILALCSPSAGI